MVATNTAAGQKTLQYKTMIYILLKGHPEFTSGFFREIGCSTFILAARSICSAKCSFSQTCKPEGY